MQGGGPRPRTHSSVGEEHIGYKKPVWRGAEASEGQGLRQRRYCLLERVGCSSSSPICSLKMVFGRRVHLFGDAAVVLTAVVVQQKPSEHILCSTQEPKRDFPRGLRQDRADR